jgi:hypothetical protein
MGFFLISCVSVYLKIEAREEIYMQIIIFIPGIPERTNDLGVSICVVSKPSMACKAWISKQ